MALPRPGRVSDLPPPGPRRYNAVVPAKPQPDHPSSERNSPIYAREAAGVLIIGLLLLILILVRYWHYIAWSGR